MRVAVVVASACGGDAAAPLLNTTPTSEPARVVVTLPVRALPLGETVQASAAVFDSAGNRLAATEVIWSSTAPGVASVSASGLIVAIGSGTAQISALARNAIGSDSVVVLAPPPSPLVRRVATVSISSTASTLHVGASVQLAAVARDSTGSIVEGRAVSWTVDSAGRSVASVSNNGVVTALAAGTAVVRAIVDSVGASAAITVTPTQTAPPVVRSIPVTLSNDTVLVGQVAQASAVALDSTGAVVPGQTFMWSIDSASVVASVSNQGTITALAPGTARVRATVGGVSGSALLTVSPVPTAPPKFGSIPLVMTRLTAGVGPVLVSNAIPLLPGALFASQLADVLLMVNGAEVPIAVAATAGAHKDGSLRTVVVQTTYDIPAAGVPATLQLGAPRTKHASAASIPSVPSAVALPTDPVYLIATELVGPTIPVTTVKALGGVWSKYENDFLKFSDQHWAQSAEGWSGNYYDRVQIYFAWWVRTGNVEYWRRATLMAYDYRTKYLELNNYGSSHHWAQLEGLALHYWLTGDPMSQRAVGRTADVLASYYRKGGLANINHPDMESRIQARSLLGMLLAWEIQAPGAGNYAPNTWGTHLPQMLTQILQAQNANGAFLWNGYCGASINYMNGLLNDVMIRYFDRFQRDPRIAASVKANADWLWSNQWRPDGSFNYQSIRCARNNSGPAASVDLNGLHPAVYGWLYTVTGNTAYREAADSIFAYGVRGAFLSGDKQFNQEYTSSFRYLAYRR